MPNPSFKGPKRNKIEIERAGDWRQPLRAGWFFRGSAPAGGRAGAKLNVPCGLSVGALVSRRRVGRAIELSVRSLRNRIRDSGPGARLDRTLLGWGLHLE